MTYRANLSAGAGPGAGRRGHSQAGEVRKMGRDAGPPGLCCSRFVSDEGSSACFLLHGIFYPGNRAEVGVLRPQDCIVHPGGCQNNAICHWEAFLEADAGGVEGERRA